MREEIRPLEIAFMGRDLRITNLFLRQFVEDNAEQVARHRNGRVILKDGTIIEAISPAMVRTRFDGRRYDQLILADDARGMIEIDAIREVEIIKWAAMRYSCVPEEYQILRYNADAPAPRPRPEAEITVEGIKELTEAIAAAGIAAAEAAEAFLKLSQAAREAAPEAKRGRKL